MLHTDISQRIQAIMHHYALSPSQLADKLNIQRSNVSHFTSGRNYPSFEVLQRILTAFSDLEISWLIQGTGNMIKNRAEPPATALSNQLNFGITGQPTVRPQTPKMPPTAPQNAPTPAPPPTPPPAPSPQPILTTNDPPAAAYLTPAPAPKFYTNPANSIKNINNAENTPKKAVKIAVFYDDGSFDFFLA